MSTHRFTGKPWIQTLTGGICITDPDIEDITLDDIAGALSKLCRFGGHTPVFYSVAQHSVLVSEIVKSIGAPKNIILGALFHDAAEAYLGDIMTPVKRLFGNEFKSMESIFNSKIDKKFKLDGALTSDKMNTIIHDADIIALKTEVRDILNGEKYAWVWPSDCKELEYNIEPLDHKSANNLFIETYYRNL